MSESKHTPGPVVRIQGFDATGNVIWEVTGRRIAQYRAAPDLLAVARWVADFSAYDCPFCDPETITLQVDAEHTCAEVPAARAAVAKAEGK